MVNYAKLSEKRKQFLGLTGSTSEEFQTLVPIFQKSYLKHMEVNTLEGKKRWKRHYVYIATVH